MNPLPGAALNITKKAESTLEGLYAAGDEYFNGIGPAATYGYIAGENAAQYAKNREIPEKAGLRSDIEEKIALVKGAGSRKVGASWQEANIALSQIMHDYLGATLTQTMMEAGLSHLRS